ncbi:MAG: hypothetical protein ACOYN2_06625 [Patescibacteria group bacterium]
MKRLFAILATLSLVAHSTGAIYAADAVAADTDHLEVTAAATAKVGEAMDLTVKAVAKDGSVVKNYVGTVFVIVDNDNKATVPYSEGYTFTSSDQGQKTFSKGLSFTKEGTFKVVVSDFDKPKIEGNTKVKVSVGEASTATGGELVTITSPDADSTLGGTDLAVTGATKKNSKVQLFLNGTKALESQTDDKGAFMFQVKNVDQSQNIVSVKVLDGTDKVIGESSKVSVKVGSEGPAFNSLALTTGATKGTKANDYSAVAGAKIAVSVNAEAGLKEVTVTAGTSVEVLKESKTTGKYEGEITAPTASGTTSIDVSLKNALGKTTLKTAAATLMVTQPDVAFKNIKVEKADKKVMFTFEVDNEPADLAKFEFSYTTGTGAPEKSLTFEKAKIKTASGSYSWYVSGLAIAKYTFQISGVGADGKVMTNVVSDPIEVDLALGSAQKCLISNVGGVKVTSTKDASTISWDSIPEAVTYNVYKKDNTGKFVFIEAVKSNTYTINLSSGPVKYEDFAIKAVCSDATESSEYSPTTRVKTGPAQIALMVALSLGLGFALLRRRKA